MTNPPLHFIHITDTHLNAPSKEPFLKLDPWGNLRAVLAEVRALPYKPAFVVITGDLAHEGDAEDYRAIRQGLTEESTTLGAPILVALGNHDHRDAFNAGYLGQPGSDAAYYFAQDFDGLRVIVLDSHWVGSHSGRLDEAQLAWLREQLAAPAPRGTLLCLHHPPHINLYMKDTSRLLTNSDALAQVIAGSDVIGILSGHVHMNSMADIQGALSVTGQATAFGLDANETRGMRLIDAWGYNVCIVHEGGLVVQPFEMPASRREVMFMTHEQIATATQRHTLEKAMTEQLHNAE